MTKKYWWGVLFFSLLIAVGAGYFVYSTLQKKSPVEVPLQSIPPAPSPVKETPPAETTTTTTSSAAVTEPAIKKEKTKHANASEEPAKKVEEVSSNSAKRNILFAYRKASAKEVFVIGSFNKWTREPMAKNDKGLWQVSLKLAPGTYEYKFVVDNRKIRDPNNRLYTPAGNSILKVKPLAEK